MRPSLLPCPPLPDQRWGHSFCCPARSPPRMRATVEETKFLVRSASLEEDIADRWASYRSSVLWRAVLRTGGSGFAMLAKLRRARSRQYRRRSRRGMSTLSTRFTHLLRRSKLDMLAILRTFRNVFLFVVKFFVFSHRLSREGIGIK